MYAIRSYYALRVFQKSSAPLFDLGVKLLHRGREHNGFSLYSPGRLFKGINLKQNISYSRKLSKNHTGTLESTYNYQNDKPITEWLTDKQILQGLIPLVDDSVYNILQTKKSNFHNVNAVVKDYWVLNNFNHLYTSVGFNTTFNRFYSQDVQQLTNGFV